MGAKAGWFMAGVARLPGVTTCKTPKESSARTGDGRAPIAGKMECGDETTWTRRRQLSVSAGFCMACRSSVTEMTGNRIRISTARATTWVLRLAPARRAYRSQMHRIVTADSAHARFRISSIRDSGSTPEEHGIKGTVMMLGLNRDYRPAGKDSLKIPIKL